MKTFYRLLARGAKEKTYLLEGKKGLSVSIYLGGRLK
jgi:hypothetical protein